MNNVDEKDDNTIYRMVLTARFQAPAIQQPVNLLREEKPRVPWSFLVALQANGSKPPFFWIHGDRTEAFLPSYLGSDQPLYGLRHQSQDGKPARYTRVETIAAHYLKEILTVQPQSPYLLGGYSFGGTVAFEIAQQLERQGKKVALLFLLDSQFPGNRKSSSPVNSSCPNVLTNVRLFREEVHRHLRNLALLGSQEKLSYLLVRVKGKIKERIVRINRILRELVCKLYLAMGRPLPISYRSCYILGIYRQARLKYAPQLYLGEATYIKSEERPNDDLSDWGKVIAGGLEVYEVPSGHTAIRKKEMAHLWAETLKACLHRATGGGSFCVSLSTLGDMFVRLVMDA